MDYMERKRLLPHGAAMAVARQEGVGKSYVSDVMRGHRTGPKTRRIKVALARKMGVKVDVAWPPADLSKGAA